MSVVGSIFAASTILGGGSLLASALSRSIRRLNPITVQVQQAFISAKLCNLDRNNRPILWPIINTHKVRSGAGEGLLLGHKITMRYAKGRTIYDVMQVLDRMSEWLNATLRVENERGKLALYVFDLTTPVSVPFTPDLLARIRGTWEVPIGLGERGWIVHDFANAPHLLIGGETGGGKTNYLTLMLYSLIRTHPFQTMRFHIVDLKRGLSFRFLSGSPYLAGVSDGKGDKIDRLSDVLNLVTQIEATMHRHLEMLEKWQVTSWQEAAVQGHSITHHFLIVDEMAEITGKSKDAKEIVEQIWDKISSLVRLGRAAAVHVVLSTQRPQVDVIPGDIKANLDGRLAFRLPDAASSVTILGVGGAENIPPITGRAIYRLGDNHLVQTPKIDLSSIRLRMFLGAKRQKDMIEFENLSNEWVV